MDIVPFIKYSGDRERAVTLRRFALTQLKVTEDLMKFRDLKQYKRRITLPGGIVIICKIQFGLPMVEIHVPPMIPEMAPPPPPDRKSTRLNSSHPIQSRKSSSA